MRTFPNPPKIHTLSKDSAYETSDYNNQYEVQWRAPPDNGEPIDMYEIRYCQVKRVGQEWQELEGTCQSNQYKGNRAKEWLKDLNSDSFYRVEVRAHNIIGFGKAGVLYFKTARGNFSLMYHSNYAY